MAKPDKKAKSNGKRPLTPKQLLFCVEYVSDPDRNATQAAIRAGYSLKSAKFSARNNITRYHVQSEIARLESELREEAEINSEITSPEELLLGYTRDIRFDPATLYNKKKQLIPIPDLPKEVRMSLCGAKYNV